jgi:hypothetical protein
MARAQLWKTGDGRWKMEEGSPFAAFPCLEDGRWEIEDGSEESLGAFISPLSSPNFHLPSPISHLPFLHLA